MSGVQKKFRKQKMYHVISLTKFSWFRRFQPLSSSKLYNELFPQILNVLSSFPRLSTIRTNMPIEEHRRSDIFKNVETKFFVGGASDGRTWPFGPVRKNC